MQHLCLLLSQEYLFCVHLCIDTDRLTLFLNLVKGCLRSGTVVTEAHTVTGSSPACSVTSAVSNSLRPYGPQPTGLLCPWGFWGSCLPYPGKNTGVGDHALLLGIFPTQGSNPHLFCLLHWQAGSFPLAPSGNSWKQPWSPGENEAAAVLAGHGHRLITASPVNLQ